MISALCCEHSACSAARALPALLRVSLPAAVEGPGAGLQQASSKNNNLKINKDDGLGKGLDDACIQGSSRREALRKLL